MRRARGGRAGGRRGRRPKSRLPSKAEYVEMGLRFGFSAEHLEAEYDRAAAPPPGP